VTTANENLRAERAASGEAGMILKGFQDRTFLRANAFCTEISRTVANVTLSAGPTLTIRQRQNLGRTRSCGIELDASQKVSDGFQVSAGYLFVDPRVVSFPANRALEGLLIPQVARHQFTFQAQYSNPKFARAGLQFRASSSQFEDDQNLIRLRSYASVDAVIARPIGRRCEIFAAAENLFNSKIETGRTPVLTIAGHRTVRVGIRIRFGKTPDH
jgi:outer membrane receptor protein involved in Fe transport